MRSVPSQILLFDADTASLAAVRRTLEAAGLTVLCSTTIEETRGTFGCHAVDLVVVDISDGRCHDIETGLELIRELRRASHVPVVVLSGLPDAVVPAFEAGATDYLFKHGLAAERLVNSIERSLVRTRSASLVPEIVGSSPAIRKISRDVLTAAKSEICVLITGEPGVGKEVVAQALHRHSARAGRFVGLNLCGIAPGVFESELFGHARGAFTGAHENKTGYFEQASRGTILLDEIGDLSMSSQAGLLRVLEDRTFAHVGSVHARPLTARVVCSTNVDLPRAIQQQRFRHDLLTRIEGFPLHIPPLRARPEDISLLAEHFARRLDTTLSQGALEWLSEQPLPGNARELRNLVERAHLCARHPERLVLADFDSQAGHSAHEPADGSLLTLMARHRSVEAAAVRTALAAHGGNMTRAAAALGIERRRVARLLTRSASSAL